MIDTFMPTANDAQERQDESHLSSFPHAQSLPVQSSLNSVLRTQTTSRPQKRRARQSPGNEDEYDMKFTVRILFTSINFTFRFNKSN